jgi:hypothetical protein
VLRFFKIITSKTKKYSEFIEIPKEEEKTLKIVF